MEEASLLGLLELLALATATFLGLHFITSKERSQQILGAFLLLGFVFDLADRSCLFLGYDFPFEFIPNMAFIFIPFLYFYSLQLAGQSNKKMWRLLYPACIFYLAHLVALLFEADFYFFIENQLSYLFSIYISFLVLKAIQIHQKNIFQYFSTIEDKELNWLRILTIILIIFNVLWMIEDAIYIFTDWNPFLSEFSALATFFTVYWIGFSSLKQKEVFKEVIVSTQATQISSKLSKEESNLFRRLNTLMIEESLFKNVNLTLRDIAVKLETSDKKLSKVINVKTQNNFYYFVNTYRVECFKRTLQTSTTLPLTLFGIAEDCGFKTRSTFFTFFKRIEGVTPNEFLQRK